MKIRKFVAVWRIDYRSRGERGERDIFFYRKQAKCGLFDVGPIFILGVAPVHLKTPKYVLIKGSCVEGGRGREKGGSEVEA